MKKVKYSYLSISFLIILLLLPYSKYLLADSFKEQIKIGETYQYKHWDLKKKEITGYSIFTYKKEKKGKIDCILEINQNTKKDGTVFSQKEVWFDFNSGQLLKYWEKDLRNGLEIKEEFVKNNIITEVLKDGKSIKFKIKRHEQLIPLEVITLSLRKKLPAILQNKFQVFDLYLPLFAFELEKNGLPNSLSVLKVKAQLEKQVRLKTPIGQKDAVVITIKPMSYLLNTILPKEKTEFRFTFDSNPPFLLLIFEENGRKNILEKIEYQPKK